MPFVKLDCGILTSTLWMDQVAREVFITALLMAEPAVFDEAIPQIATRSLDRTGWFAPPGWYGFVPAANVGIIRTAGVEREAGLDALERLASPDEYSRSYEFEGRRLIRIDGGYLILNYIKYRERDYTGAERQRRYRQRKSDGVTVLSDGVTSRPVTQAEAEVEGEEEKIKKGRNTEMPRKLGAARKKAPDDFEITDAMREWALKSCPGVDLDRETESFKDYTFASAKTDWPATWRNWIRKSVKTGTVRPTRYAQLTAQAQKPREQDPKLLAFMGVKR